MLEAVKKINKGWMTMGCQMIRVLFACVRLKILLSLKPVRMCFVMLAWWISVNLPQSRMMGSLFVALKLAARSRSSLLI
jgi:hypothetical protein